MSLHEPITEIQRPAQAWTRVIRKLGLVTLVTLTTPTLLVGAESPPGAALFAVRCATCHTVGQGDDVGPDLEGVTARRERPWLLSFIRSSQTMVLAGDPLAGELFERFGRQKMPDHDLTPEEIESILVFIEAGGPSEPKLRLASSATPEEIKTGRALFFGRQPLDRDGPPCVSCHTVSNQIDQDGGSLGGSLTHVYSKYYDVELARALRRHPGMPALYRDRTITGEEEFVLRAFLKHTDATSEEEGVRLAWGFPLWGLAMSMLLVTGQLARERRRRRPLDR